MQLFAGKRSMGKHAGEAANTTRATGIKRRGEGEGKGEGRRNDGSRRRVLGGEIYGGCRA